MEGFKDHISQLLGQFQGISLGEMEQVSLMKRIDNKYVFPISSLSSILEDLKEAYFALDIGGKRASRYETLYYDTHDFRLYYDHQRGKLNRFKVRERTYVDTHASFTEVKFKNNKAKTYKNRISIEEISQGLNGDSMNFVTEMTSLDPNKLEPVLWVNYDRITLVNKQMNERATIDIGLSFSFHHKEVNFQHIVIVEAKRDSNMKYTPIMEVMKEHSIRPSGFSKYCIGVTQIYPQFKQNRFKKNLLYIQQFDDEIA